MKIVFVSSLYHPHIIGGAERVVQFLAENLSRLGCECHVITLTNESTDFERIINGVHVHYFRLRNIYWPFNDGSKNTVIRSLWHAIDTMNPVATSIVGRLLRDIHPDVVHTHNIAGFSVAVWRAAKKRKIPVIHTLHDAYLLCPRTTMFRNGGNCASQCVVCRCYSLPRKVESVVPDVVVGVSKFILERHINAGLFSRAEKRVVYNAYERPVASQRPKLPPKPDAAALRVGYVGRLDVTKGIGLLLDVWARMPTGRAKLIIAGKGSPTYVSELVAKVGARSDVEWLGFVPPETVFSSIDLLVVPSLWHDTAPLVALEALAWGVPAIVSNRGGLPELMPADVGWIFDPERPESLLELLTRCIANGREDLQPRAVAAIATSHRFTSKQCVEGYARIYADHVRT